MIYLKQIKCKKETSDTYVSVELDVPDGYIQSKTDIIYAK